jgi:hypothetical protein
MNEASSQPSTRQRSSTRETVRAIRIKATGANGSNGWWSIGEIRTDCWL